MLILKQLIMATFEQFFPYFYEIFLVEIEEKCENPIY